MCRNNDYADVNALSSLSLPLFSSSPPLLLCPLLYQWFLRTLFMLQTLFTNPLHVHVQPMIRALPTFLLRPIVHFVGWLGCCLGLSVPALGVKPFPFGTCIVTSVGSMGMDTAFAPHTPWAHVPLLVMVGAVADKAVARNGQAVVRPTLTLTCTLDHRFADGSAAAHVAKRIRTFIENPVSTHACV